MAGTKRYKSVLQESTCHEEEENMKKWLVALAVLALTLAALLWKGKGRAIALLLGASMACGLLWSNWCEYKRQMGVEFGEYADCQYECAKTYYEIAAQEIGRLKEG